MNQKEREELIEFIKTYDSTYNYNAVDFRYYSDKDLLVLKKRLDVEIKSEPNAKSEDDGIRLSSML